VAPSFSHLLSGSRHKSGCWPTAMWVYFILIMVKGWLVKFWGQHCRVLKSTMAAARNSGLIMNSVLLKPPHMNPNCTEHPFYVIDVPKHDMDVHWLSSECMFRNWALWTSNGSKDNGCPCEGQCGCPLDVSKTDIVEVQWISRKYMLI